MRVGVQKWLRVLAKGAAAGLVAVLCLQTAASAAVQAEIVATKAQVQAFCGTSNVKVAFINKPYLYYIDFSATTPSIVEVTGSNGAILPIISPDGQWIVYSKGPSTDGNLAASGVAAQAVMTQFSASAEQKVVVSSKAYEPRFVPNASQLTIIYADSNGNGTYNGAGKTWKLAVPNGVPSGSPTVVWDNGSYIGGISWNNQYISTGLPDAIIADVNAGTRTEKLHQYTFVSSTGLANTVYPMQVCNPSMSTSRRYFNMMLDLDFGFPTATTPFDYSSYYLPGIYNNQKWAQHEIIFIMSADNTIKKYYVAPGPATLQGGGDSCTVTATNITYPIIRWTRYDDPEWSNHPYFAAANLEVRRRWCEGEPREVIRHEVIYILNLKDSTALPIARSTNLTNTTTVDLQWPSAWIEVPQNFTEEPWLGASGVEDGRSLFPHRAGGMKLALEGNTVSFNAPVREIAVYTLLGGLVNRTPVSARVGSVRLGDIPTGTYFVQATGFNGERATARWNVMK